MKKYFVMIAVAAVTYFTILPALTYADQPTRKDTVIKLDYNPIDIELPECSVPLAVVKFSEPKPIEYVGISTKFKFKPSPDVGTWMAKALMAQLEKAGYKVSYFESMDEAGDNFILTGIANRVVFERPGELDMRYKVRLDGMVVKNNKLLFAKNYMSKQEKEMLYTGSNAGKLEGGLHDIFDMFLPEAIKAVNDNAD